MLFHQSSDNGANSAVNEVGRGAGDWHGTGIVFESEGTLPLAAPLVPRFFVTMREELRRVPEGLCRARSTSCSAQYACFLVTGAVAVRWLTKSGRGFVVIVANDNGETGSKTTQMLLNWWVGPRVD